MGAVPRGGSHARSGQPLADDRLVVKGEVVIMNRIAEHDVGGAIFQLCHNALNLVDAVHFVIHRHDNRNGGGQCVKRGAQVNLCEVVKKQI